MPSPTPKKTPRIFGAHSTSHLMSDKATHKSNASKSSNTKKSSHPKSSKGKKFVHVAAVGSKSRAAAAQIVNAVSDGISLSEAFPLYCKQYQLDARDTAFVKEIVYGTLRHRRVLQTTLKPMFDYKIVERHRIVQALLLTAFYQIVHMRVPAHAVVAATVSACGDCSRKAFTALVNAILRRFLREGAKLAEPTETSVKYSFPDWLCNRIQEDYPQEYTQILQASNEKAPLFLRVELSKISLDDYMQLLKDADIEASTVSLSPCTVMLAQPLNVSEIPGFNQGLCSVQDLSAQLAAPLLNLDSSCNNSDFRILDCCCAPGGKTAHILDLVPNATVLALDVEDSRLLQTRETLSRLQRVSDNPQDELTKNFSIHQKQEQVSIMKLNAQEIDKLEGEFDRILVDAPCSGTGVIRRHPDIKWLRRERDIGNLVQTQIQILDAAYNKLKSGGILVYTTCSVLHAENQQQVQAFLERHKEAQLKPFTIGEHSYSTLQRLPNQDQGDGFFYARFVKP